ncbi:MAG: Csp1 family four helix bundle copper storage protein [Rhodoplanes sp.]|nr:Csp1 family four helix bundle copper storage protein [Rhodoplanes sp.]
MNRRHVLTTAAALAVVAGPAFAQGHAGHDSPSGLNAPLVAAATNCVRAGLACINHCFDSLAAGDTSLAACARSVDQMSAVCGALAKLASAGSPHLPAMAKLAQAVCLDCEKECRKHADHHAVCKACADACAACAEECRKVAA